LLGAYSRMWKKLRANSAANGACWTSMDVCGRSDGSPGRIRSRSQVLESTQRIMKARAGYPQRYPILSKRDECPAAYVRRSRFVTRAAAGRGQQCSRDHNSRAVTEAAFCMALPSTHGLLQWKGAVRQESDRKRSSVSKSCTAPMRLGRRPTRDIALGVARFAGVVTAMSCFAKAL